MDSSVKVRWQLKRIIKDHQVTASAIAKELGVTRPAVSLWVHADTLPGIGGSRLAAIADAINKHSKIGGGVEPLDLLR